MLIIEENYLSEIISHAKDNIPSEACGILAGRNGRIERVYKMTNTSDSPQLCYFMDPKEQFKVMKEIRNSGLELTGIYHSHPGSEAYPSARDIELAFYPEAAYIIVSLEDIKNPKVRAYKIVEGRIDELEIVNK